MFSQLIKNNLSNRRGIALLVICSLRGRRSKGKGKGISSRDHAQGRRKEGNFPFFSFLARAPKFPLPLPLLILPRRLHKIIVDFEYTSFPVRQVFNQARFQENIPQKLLKYLKQQNPSPVPLLPAMQEIQGNVNDVLSGNDLRDERF